MVKSNMSSSFIFELFDAALKGVIELVHGLKKK